MDLKDQLAIHAQREETARKNRVGSVVMCLLALFALAIVYFSTRHMAEEQNARLIAINKGCKFISNHRDETGKVVVMNCSGITIQKAYE